MYSLTNSKISYKYKYLMSVANKTPKFAEPSKKKRSYERHVIERESSSYDEGDEENCYSGTQANRLNKCSPAGAFDFSSGEKCQEYEKQLQRPRRKKQALHSAVDHSNIPL